MANHYKPYLIFWMKISIRVAENFKKKAKPLLRKYPSLRIELKLLEQTLTKNPTFSTPMGGQVYKIRLAKKVKDVAKVEGPELSPILKLNLLERKRLLNKL